MKLIISVRSSLLFISVLSLCLRANAFTVTRLGSKSASSLNKQRFITASAAQSASRSAVFGRRHFSSHSNEDVDRDSNTAKTLTPVAVQVFKTMMMASIISTASILTTDIASVSAANFDHLNDNTSPSFLLAKGAYVPEAGYDTLDFSMPSYRVDADVEPIKINDIIGGSTNSGNEDRSSATTKKASTASSPNRAEKGALAVAQAKAKKEAAKADALAKQEALKGKAFLKSETESD